MAKEGLIVTGDEQLDRTLAALEPKLQKRAIRKATRAASKQVLATARQRVPSDEGDLERSLKVRALKRSRNRVGHQVLVSDGLFEGDEFYGGFVEFGTQQRFHKTTGKSVGRIDPGDFDFLRPSLYENRTTVLQIFNNTMRSELQQIAREAKAQTFAVGVSAEGQRVAI